MPGGSFTCVLSFPMTPFLFHEPLGVCCCGPLARPGSSLESAGQGGGSKRGVRPSGCGFPSAGVAPLHLVVDIGLLGTSPWQSTPDRVGTAVYTWQTELSFPSCISLSYRINFF